EIKGISTSHFAIWPACTEIKGIFTSHFAIWPICAEIKGIFTSYFLMWPVCNCFLKVCASASYRNIPFSALHRDLLLEYSIN
ncbi:hypothetical protein, partial [Paenibacillus jilunlii]|uniref:hypothetical protein n=1 Tax=Paenibacillus jilunlii TaxID=682956 RepID=UPI001AD83735